MKESVVRISHYEVNTRMLGPGNRFVIWFQGCEKRCKGCINPAGQNKKKGYLIKIDELVDKIKRTKGIQGVTISGGEPFLQFPELQKLIVNIKESTDLDIMLYSGYKYNDLKNILTDSVCNDFFPLVDIFIDGEYIDEQNDNQMFRGSKNQNIYFFSDRYAEYKNEILDAKNRDVEFAINENSEVFLIGIPPKGFYDSFITNIKEVNQDDV